MKWQPIYFIHIVLTNNLMGVVPLRHWHGPNRVKGPEGFGGLKGIVAGGLYVFIEALYLMSNQLASNCAASCWRLHIGGAKRPWILVGPLNCFLWWSLSGLDAELGGLWWFHIGGTKRPGIPGEPLNCFSWWSSRGLDAWPDRPVGLVSVEGGPGFFWKADLWGPARGPDNGIVDPKDAGTFEEHPLLDHVGGVFILELVGLHGSTGTAVDWRFGYKLGNLALICFLKNGNMMTWSIWLFCRYGIRLVVLGQGYA